MDEVRIPAEPALSRTQPEIRSEPVPPLEDYAAQRRHPRIRCFLVVQLRPADHQSLLLGKLSDVSLGGCGVESPASIPTGSKVAISPLAAAGALWVEGVVVNTRLAEGAAGFHIGVRFLGADASSSAGNIQQFVRFVEDATRKTTPADSYLKRIARGKA